ncbi:hypothetical protein PNQ92_11145 [Halobacterium salinarum]|uniref:hypothetical protein n=1 Tax=Halobacterium salinarum TaxID=2242 RepID=UPI00255608A0|nr:hypothetical protein [Halobacterium salinarum]MDL0125961.1 hypothetical protein [Halobacterium salinarum]
MTIAVLDTAAVANARNRDGEPREDRPKEAEKALETEEVRVGFQNGTPLLERDYTDYPTGEDILQPSASDALEAVATHEMVGTVADIGHELRADESTVETALGLHGVEPPTDGASFDVVDGDEINVPLHGTIDTHHFRTPLYEDGRLLEHLYVRCGYGIGEIRQWLKAQMNHGRDPEKARWSVTEDEIRDGLEAVGLLEATEAAGVDPANHPSLAKTRTA